MLQFQRDPYLVTKWSVVIADNDMSLNQHSYLCTAYEINRIIETDEFIEIDVILPPASDKNNIIILWIQEKSTLATDPMHLEDPANINFLSHLEAWSIAAYDFENIRLENDTTQNQQTSRCTASHINKMNYTEESSEMDVVYPSAWNIILKSAKTLKGNVNMCERGIE